MRFRALHYLYARAAGYFWQRCPLCGRGFGGHEWRRVDGRWDTVVSAAPEPDRAICPGCTQAGRGDGPPPLVGSVGD